MGRLSLKRDTFVDDGDEESLPLSSPLRPFVPSGEQLAISHSTFNDRGNLLINAGAGTGKTTTLVELLRGMRGYCAAVMYNRKNVNEFSAKLEERGVNTNVRVNTFHGFGFGSWRRTAPKAKLEGKGDGQAGYFKLDKVYEALAKEGHSVPYSYRGAVKSLVSLSKQYALGIDAPPVFDELEYLVGHHDLESDLCDISGEFLDGGRQSMVGKLIEYTMRALPVSNQMSFDVIDFDDMVYMALFKKCQPFQVDWLVGDEIQDINVSRLKLAQRMLRRDGKFIGVGDRRQAIYGFTGSMSHAIDTVAEVFRCKQLPLSISYRCPVRVVEHAKPFMPELQPHPDAPLGVVGEMDKRTFMRLQFYPTDAILCRRNAPLIRLAYNFIRQGTACRMEGRDIGEGLIKLVDKWKVAQLSTLSGRLETFKEKGVARLMATGKASQAEALADRVETLQALIDGMPPGATVPDVRSRILSLFQDSSGNRKQCLTLSSCHKAKGLEWPRVYLYGRNLWMPSKYATQDWEIEQENNLIGVAITRSMSEFYEVVVKKGDE